MTGERITTDVKRGVTRIQIARCRKCMDTGVYQYDHNHATVCDACCPHDQGWWQLTEGHGEHNVGLWCCKRGCGFTQPRGWQPTPTQLSSESSDPASP